MIRLLTAALLIGAFSSLTAMAQEPSASDTPGTRHFELDYSGAIKDVPENSKVRVWIPLAQSGDDQEILQVTSQTPVESRETSESVHGNKMLYFDFETKASEEIPFRVTFEVRRKEVNALQPRSTTVLTDEQRRLYTAANRLVPIDGKPIMLLTGINFSADKIQAGRRLYDCVEDFMTYDKTNPGYGNGDVLWACDSKTGNCTDFHSVFISLARHQKIPAHFEIGFPLPTKRGEGEIGGYHCWARFFVDDHGWVPVDISEADKHPEMKDYYFGNLTENRIAFTKGRDIDLQPKQDGDPLNYFVYPHVEVNGKVWPKEKVALEFRFKDID